jgi:hypothetical protein
MPPSGNRRRGFLRPASLFLGIALAAGCSDTMVSEPEAGVHPDARPFAGAVSNDLLMAPEDSAAYEGSGRPGAGSVTIQAWTPIVLAEPGGFELEVVGTSCAAQGNTVTVVEPVTGTLTTNGCADLGATFREDGPFDAGTEIRLAFRSGYTGGTGDVRVTGGYPEWRVAFEDGYDADYNDLVVAVRATVAAQCPADDYFQDPSVVEGLEDLVARSGFDGPQTERREQYGWIVESEDGYELVPLANEATNPCQVAADPTPPPGTVGFVHTHPFSAGERVAPGVCPQAPNGGTFRSGPSQTDRSISQFINDQVGTTVPAFIIDPSGVTRFTVVQDPEGTPRVDEERDFPGCIVAGRE